MSKVLSVFKTSQIGNENDMTGQLGFCFSVTRSIDITCLGRSGLPSMATNHTIYLWDWDSREILATVNLKKKKKMILIIITLVSFSFSKRQL